MERILITGGAGFIGSNAANILSGKGYDVIALDNLFIGKRKNLKLHVKFILGNTRDINNLKQAGKVDCIIHLAAISSSQMFKDLRKAYTNNISGFLNVLEYARKTDVKKVMFASTSTIYGNGKVPYLEHQKLDPINFYSVEKQCEEETARIFSESYGMDIIGFRFMSIYGKNEEHKGIYANLVSQFLWSMRAGYQAVIYGNGNQTRDFMDVRDVVRIFLLAMKSKKLRYQIFNVGTGKETSFIKLADTINKVLKKHIKPKFADNPFGDNYILRQRASLKKIKKMLGFELSINLEQGVRDLEGKNATNKKRR